MLGRERMEEHSDAQVDSEVEHSGLEVRFAGAGLVLLLVGRRSSELHALAAAARKQARRTHLDMGRSEGSAFDDAETNVTRSGSSHSSHAARKCWEFERHLRRSMLRWSSASLQMGHGATDSDSNTAGSTAGCAISFTVVAISNPDPADPDWL